MTINIVLADVDLEERSLVVENEGTGIKCYIPDIELIRYKRGINGKKAADKGFLIGGGIGIIAGLGANSRSVRTIGYSFGIWGVAITALLAGGLGALIGRISGSGPHYKDFLIRYASPAQIEKHLKKFKSLALLSK